MHEQRSTVTECWVYFPLLFGLGGRLAGDRTEFLFLVVYFAILCYSQSLFWEEYLNLLYP